MSILKVESTSKFPRWIDVIISTWIRLSNSMKSRQTFHVEFRRRINGESTKMCPLGYLFKVNNRNSIKRCEICSKLTIKTPKRRHWRRFGVFILNVEHHSHPFQCFYCSLWTSKCYVGNKKYSQNLEENASYFKNCCSSSTEAFSKKHPSWYFPVNFVKCFRSAFLYNAFQQLLLNFEQVE